MRIEKLSKWKSKKIILAITIIVLAIGIMYITNSKAKYQVTKSVQIVNGNINYSLADFNLMAVYLQDKQGDEGKPNSYTKASNGTVPTTGYSLKPLGNGTYDSYCMVDNQRNNSGITIGYENGGVNFKGIKKQGTKCYLYFDVESKPTSEKTLANLKLGNSLGTITTVTGPSCGSSTTTCYSGDSKTNNMKQNGIYDTVDDYGKSYVFRGEVDNNWVKFGKKGSDDIWWRIIRINGNGTIRLIYAGTGSSAPATNTSITQIGTNAFNSTRSDNRYVGFMYNSNSDSSQVVMDSNPSDSSIKGKLDSWWTETNLGASPQVDKIDVETGFCNDRGLSAADHGSYKGPGGGTGTTQTAYAPWDRLLQSGTEQADTTQRPSLKCANPTRDLFTGQNSKGVITSSGTIVGNKKLKNPVGLITSDEAIYAGCFFNQNNNKYWLYTHQDYWTMTPSYFYNFGSSQFARVFIVSNSGSLGNGNYVVNNALGVRPVINLSADTQFTGTGKSESPFVPK